MSNIYLFVVVVVVLHVQENRSEFHNDYEHSVVSRVFQAPFQLKPSYNPVKQVIMLKVKNGPRTCTITPL